MSSDSPLDEKPDDAPVNYPRPTHQDTARRRTPAASIPVTGAGSARVPGETTESAAGFWSLTMAPFRKAVIRGLAVVMPPLLTIVLFLWAWNTIDSYVLSPMEGAARYVIAWGIADIRGEAEMNPLIASLKPESGRYSKIDGFETYKTESGSDLVKVKKFWIPLEVYDAVELSPGREMPITAAAYYDRYVQLRYLRREIIIPLFLIAFVILLYLTGKTLAVGVGRMFWTYAEAVVNKVPLIRNVYSSVKQVTDFAFTETDIQCRRIVAIEYPRKGIWSLGFVTGEGMSDIRAAANEPVVTVLVPTSPMPATGFTITVPRSETIDLNISMDQAIQFCVSCGVVVPNLDYAGAAALEGRSQTLGPLQAPPDAMIRREP